VTIKPTRAFKSQHKVQPGETLTKIAARYKVSVSDLEKTNNLSSGKILVAGTWIRVPPQLSISGKPAESRRVGAQAKPSPLKDAKSANEKTKRDLSKTAGSISKDKLEEKAKSKQIASR
jgi:LysM repeat protein